MGKITNYYNYHMYESIREFDYDHWSAYPNENLYEYTICPFDKMIQKKGRMNNFSDWREEPVKVTIGTYDNKKESWNDREKKLLLVDGTFCSSNGFRRKGEIEFVCNKRYGKQDGTTSLVTEPETCVYKVQWYTDLVCP